MAELTDRAVLPLIRRALAEDRAHQDVTSATVIPPGQRIKAHIIAKAPGIAAGIKIALLTFKTFDPSLRVKQHVRSGAKVSPGKVILTIEGKARAVFAAERVALNFLMHLSGIATLTHAFVQQARGTRARIMDTRKTIPSWRLLAKYAVRAGGGHNHRSDLAEAILVKTNHLRVGPVRSIAAVLAKAHRVRPRRFLEVEVANLTEYRQALAAQPDAILLDNWTPAAVHKAVHLRHGRKPLLEVSGGVRLENVRKFARAGVDRISIGRLTHSAPALDFSLKVIDG